MQARSVACKAKQGHATIRRMSWRQGGQLEGYRQLASRAWLGFSEGLFLKVIRMKTNNNTSPASFPQPKSAVEMKGADCVVRSSSVKVLMSFSPIPGGASQDCTKAWPAPTRSA